MLMFKYKNNMFCLSAIDLGYYYIAHCIKLLMKAESIKEHFCDSNGWLISDSLANMISKNENSVI